MFTIDDLDAKLKQRNRDLANYADFTARRTVAYNEAIANYQAKLVQAGDAFARASNMSAPLAIGAISNYPVLTEISLPSGAVSVAGDTIELQKPGSPGTRSIVPRIDKDALIPSGTGHNTLAFWEEKSFIVFFAYDASACPISGAYLEIIYNRTFDTTQTTGTVLDIKQEDFDDIVDATLSFMTD